MSNNPPKLRALQTLLRELTGLPAVSLGVVGNQAHTKGYHLGRDRIFKRPLGEGKNDYSVTTRRDKDGLTDAASAIDIGNFRRLREMSKWLVAEARANAADTRDIREIIYSPDGRRVLRWDRQRGVDSRPEEGEADISHRTHTHVSWYRDSRTRDKTAVFVRFFEGGAPAKTTAPRPKVKSFSVPAVPSICTVPKNTKLFTTSRLTGEPLIVDPARSMPFIGEIVKGVAMVQRTTEDGKPTGKVFFAKASALKDIRPA